MAYAFSPYFAALIRDWLSQGDQLPTPPTDLYVTLFDDTDTELSANFTGARAAVPATSGWTVTNTSFENTNEVSLGEASSTLNNVTDAAIFDASTGGNLLLRAELAEAPFNVADGTEFRFAAGDITADILDNSEQP